MVYFACVLPEQYVWHEEISAHVHLAVCLVHALAVDIGRKDVVHCR